MMQLTLIQQYIIIIVSHVKKGRNYMLMIISLKNDIDINRSNSNMWI